MRAAIEAHGLSCLVARSGEEAAENLAAELRGEAKGFDPLMSMFWHFANAALENGGLYLLGNDERGEPRCPLCEFEKHGRDFDARTSIDDVARQMREYAIAHGLVPGAQ